MTSTHLFYSILQVFTIATLTNGAQIQVLSKPENPKANIEPSVKIQCLSGSMLITIKNSPPGHDGLFSGKIYPKGLSKNSTCLSEYREHEGILKYKLPLRSCNTMPIETDDGGMEFFNTIVLQPHLKLVTDLGRGYHVRCRYKNRDDALKKKAVKAFVALDGKEMVENPQPFKSSDDDYETAEDLEKNDRRDHGRSLDKQVSTADDDNSSNENDLDNEIPGCHMKIYNEENKIAENVHIGDLIKLVVNIDQQDKYGLYVTDCLVRDGLNWGEQKLVNEDGCPTDSEIMGPFDYSLNRLSAKVSFPAHKFPYSAAVYYQCNIRFCELEDPDCQKGPLCDGTKRPKRQTDGKDDGVPATIEVYSGLYVNENADVTEGDEGDLVFKEKTPDDALCVSQRTFAIAIAIAGLILMLAVVAAVLCIMAKRRSKTVSNSGSSIYSGPYTNTAFSHSS